MNTDIERYAQAQPQYREALDFLQNILNFQAGLLKRIKPGRQIELEVARERWQAGLPLLTGEPSPVPLSLFREALVDLRPLLPSGGTAQMALDRLLDWPLDRLDTVETVEIKAVLDGLLTNSKNSKTYIQQVAEATSTDPDTVAFLLHVVLSPFFEKQAMPYQDLVETAAWRHGICPVCGSEPEMARLSHDSGQRSLACSLCRTEWTFDRLRCPFCEPASQDHGQPYLRHFTVDDDEAHRVDCCTQCRRYIKTVDERVSGRPANLTLEDVMTAHLDVLAREPGYQ